MFGLKKKCAYCRGAIEKGKEIKRDVKRPGYVGTFKREFCSPEHAELYEKDVMGTPQKSGDCCCG